MTATAESGVLCLLKEIQALFAQSLTLQEETGKNESELLAEEDGRILLDDCVLEDIADKPRLASELRPFVLLTETDVRLTADGFGPQIQLLPTGSVMALLTANAKYPGTIDRSSNEKNAKEFRRFYGQVLTEICEENTRVLVREISLAEPPQRTIRSERTAENDFWVVVWQIDYGLVE